MNPRKRRADEPLLPLRMPKQPRTTLLGHNGENPSPSQHEGILSRWISLAREAWVLGRLSVLHIVGGPSGDYPFQSSTVSIPQIPQTHTPLPLDYALHPPLSGPLHPPALARKKSLSVLPPTLQRKQSISKLPPPAPAPKTPSTTIPPSPNNFLQSSAPSALASSSHRTPSRTRYDSHPELESALAAASPQASRRRYYNRPHIHEKLHKETVMSERQKTREEMQHELYKYRRAAGYSGDYSTFKDFLAYGAKLEKLSRREVLSPSTSMTDLRSKPPKSKGSRRHSDPEHDDQAFLLRALASARATLNAPRPKPFNPTFEQIRLNQRLKNNAIDRRLRPALPDSLSAADNVAVDALLKKRGVISKFSREQVSDVDLARLRPAQWLNDEIINFYGALILARSDECKENPRAKTAKGKKNPLKVHYFSSFFWSKLRKEGYEKGRLAKWTKKVDLFSKDIVLIPVNHGNAHWTGAAINFRQKRVESYDSMDMNRSDVFKHLRLYIDAEHRNKKKKPFDFTGWVDYTSDTTPQQENGYDCGVFTCQFLESLSRGEESFIFSQKDMPYLRRRMIWEIGNARFHDDT